MRLGTYLLLCDAGNGVRPRAVSFRAGSSAGGPGILGGVHKSEAESKKKGGVKEDVPYPIRFSCPGGLSGPLNISLDERPRRCTCRGLGCQRRTKKKSIISDQFF